MLNIKLYRNVFKIRKILISMKEFILLSLKARTDPDFKLDDLSGAGRMDLICRTISNTLWISNEVRRDTAIHVSMNGPRASPKVISFYGERLRGLDPDERSIAQSIKLALKEGLNLKLNEDKEVSSGIKISKKAFETLVKEKSGSQLLYLHPKGEDLRNFKFNNDLVFILGDNIGLPRKTEKLLDRLGAKRIKLGPKMIFASHCSVIVHNELDRRNI